MLLGHPRDRRRIRRARRNLGVEGGEQLGRGKLVRLTDGGRAAHEALVRLSSETEADLGRLIGRHDMAQLRRLLERLADQLGWGVSGP